MSKLRIIGGALIVLFLVTIIAMGVMAINLANLSTQQSSLSNDVAAIKTVLLATANSTSNTTTTTQNSTEETSLPTSQNKDCSNDVVGIKVSTPSDWTCESTPGYDGQGSISLTKSGTKILIGNLARGFTCDNTCTEYPLYQDEQTTVTVTYKDGKVEDVSGKTITGKTHSTLIIVSNTDDGALQDFSLKSEVKQILSTITNI